LGKSFGKKLSRCHAKIRRGRQDYLHKTTTKITQSYGFIGSESLNVSGMVQNRRLAKHISDVPFGELVRQLTYKSQLYGSQVQLVDQWFPSSQLCANCGAKQKMPLGIRVYACSSCDWVADRDANAAINIKIEALRLASNQSSPLG